jgi:hypothetical protein
MAAELCIRLSKDRQAREGYWFELRETAAFAMVKMGNQGTKEYGRTLIGDLLAGKTPGEGFAAAPKSWRQTRWDEYFPVTKTRRRDLHDLGRIAEPR